LQLFLLAFFLGKSRVIPQGRLGAAVSWIDFMYAEKSFSREKPTVTD